jgi:hypothetical protein
MFLDKKTQYYQDKYNLEGERAIHQKITKLQWKKQKNTQIDGMGSCVYGLEEFIFFNCPYYLKLATDSKDPLSKFLWYFPHN